MKTIDLKNKLHYNAIAAYCIIILLFATMNSCNNKEEALIPGNDNNTQLLSGKNSKRIASNENSSFSLEKRIDLLLKREIESLRIPIGDVAEFDVVHNKTKDEVFIDNLKIRPYEDVIFPLPGGIFGNSNNKYIVTCNNGDASWTDECDGKISCGGMISKCLGAGGCATICSGRVIYVSTETSNYIERKFNSKNP